MLQDRLKDDATLKLLTWNDKDGKSTFWHSSAHLMAEAVESMFPGVKFWVGPACWKMDFIMIWTWVIER